MLKVVIASFSAFVTFVIAHWLQFHFFNPVARVNWILAVAFFGLLLNVGLYFLLPPNEALEQRLSRSFKPMVKALPLLVACLVYSLLFLGYLEFYFTADRSITFRMLRITDERPTHSVTAEEMLSLYDTKGIVLYRLDDLVYGGYLEKTGDQYSVTAKGRRTLAIYRFTIDFLHMRTF